MHTMNAFIMAALYSLSSCQAVLCSSRTLFRCWDVIVERRYIAAQTPVTAVGD